MADVMQYLQEKGLDLKRGDAENVHTACFFCNESEGKRGRLYINTDPDAEIPGLFKCFLCDHKGSLITLKKHFGDRIEKEEQFGEELYGIYKAAASYYHEQLGENEQAFEWLRGPKRNLELDTIVEAQLGYAVGGGQLYKFLIDSGFESEDIIKSGLVFENKTGKKLDSLYGMVTIPYMVAGSCVGIRGRSFPYDEKGKAPKYKTCGGTKSRLYNSDAVWDATEVIICEGEFDALSMKQAGYCAVGVPGARNWQDSWDGYFVDVKRLWVLFDPDKTGTNGAKKLKDKFGHRIRQTYLLHDGLPVDVTDWLAAGHTKEDFEDVKRQALSGGLLVTVDEALVEHLETRGSKGIKFNSEELDHWISPGLLPAQVMVVLAKAGTGKTIFLLNMMQRMRQAKGQENLKFLFVSLEQTRGEWFERANRIHRFYNLNGTDDLSLDYWRENLMIIDKNRLTEAELLSALDDYEYRMGGPPDVVFIDYLGYWARSFKGDAYQRTSDAIMTLKAIAKDRRIPIITPHQVSRVAKYGEEPDADAARDAGVIEETADFVFILWTQDALHGRSEQEKSGIIHMKIGKSRHGGRGVKLDYQFAPISLTLVPVNNPSDKKNLQRARNELRFESEYHDTWEQAVYRHRTGIEGFIKEPNPAFQEKII